MKRTALLIVMVVFCLTAKAQVSAIITQAKQTRISNNRPHKINIIAPFWNLGRTLLPLRFYYD